MAGSVVEQSWEDCSGETREVGDPGRLEWAKWGADSGGKRGEGRLATDLGWEHSWAEAQLLVIGSGDCGGRTHSPGRGKAVEGRERDPCSKQLVTIATST